MHIGGIKEFLWYEPAAELIDQLLERIVTIGPEGQVRVQNDDLASSTLSRKYCNILWIDLSNVQLWAKNLVYMRNYNYIYCVSYPLGIPIIADPWFIRV